MMDSYLIAARAVRASTRDSLKPGSIWVVSAAFLAFAIVLSQAALVMQVYCCNVR